MAFGAKIKLGVDTSNLNSLKEQIQSLIDDASKLSKLKIDNIKIEIDEGSINSAIDSLRTKLEAQKFNIKVDKIDATAAMAGLRKQIASVVGTSSKARTGGLINADDLIDSKRIAAAASAASSAFSSALKTSGNIFASSEVIAAEDALMEYINAVTAAKGNQKELLQESLLYSSALKNQNTQMSKAQKQAVEAASVYTRLGTIIKDLKSVYTGSEKLSGSTRDSFQSTVESLTKQWLSLNNQVINGISAGKIVGALPTDQINALSDSVTKLKGELSGIKVSDNIDSKASELTSATSKLEDVYKQLSAIKKSGSVLSGTDAGTTIESEVRKLTSDWQQLSKLSQQDLVKPDNLNTLSSLISAADNLKQRLDALLSNRTDTIAQRLASVQKDLESISNTVDTVGEGETKNNLIKQRIELYERLRSILNDPSMMTESNISALESSVSSLASRQDGLASVESYINKLNEARILLQNMSVDSTDTAGLNAQIAQTQNNNSLLEQANLLRQQGVNIDTNAVSVLASLTDQHLKTVQTLQEQVALYGQISKLRNDVSSYLENNPKVADAAGSQFYDILDRLSSGSINLTQANAEINTLKSTFKAAGMEGQTFTQQLSTGWKKFGGWSIVTKSFQMVVNGIKKMVSSVKELDAAMTELRKVTDLTESAYSKFFDSAAATAKSIGATVADTITATADFARLGYDIDDAANLAEAALVYKNVGDGIEDVSDASESLISTISAFGLEAEDAMSIVDRFNEVGRFCPAA